MSIKPFCLCLHEIENDLPRTKFCFMPCQDQRLILRERERERLEEEEKNKDNNNQTENDN